MESTAAPAQDFIRLYVASVITRGICALSSKMSTDRLDQTRRTNDIFLPAFVQRSATVEGDDAPHINRSVEVEAIPVFSDRFSLACCQIASRRG
ncbi:hypothetical protein B5V03_38805 [Bradyrhizobium betae]|uniref:Uncharacterized protein n=1 Tax=Bradyrhizobium betae TaxID=244734 RepID=A0A4Q1UJS7_9BRAD|nr:hypothetical protein B5V03_38805 [Bradyrhizobium betae]